MVFRPRSVPKTNPLPTTDGDKFQSAPLVGLNSSFIPFYQYLSNLAPTTTELNKFQVDVSSLVKALSSDGVINETSSNNSDEVKEDIKNLVRRHYRALAQLNQDPAAQTFIEKVVRDFEVDFPTSKNVELPQAIKDLFSTKGSPSLPATSIESKGYFIEERTASVESKGLISGVDQEYSISCSGALQILAGQDVENTIQSRGVISAGVVTVVGYNWATDAATLTFGGKDVATSSFETSSHILAIRVRNDGETTISSGTSVNVLVAGGTGFSFTPPTNPGWGVMPDVDWAYKLTPTFNTYGSGDPISTNQFVCRSGGGELIQGLYLEAEGTLNDDFDSGQEMEVWCAITYEAATSGRDYYFSIDMGSVSVQGPSYAPNGAWTVTI